MASYRVKGTSVRGVVAAVPACKEVNPDSLGFPQEEALKITESVGVRERHIAGPGVCTSDLCFAAAEVLLKRVSWARESVDALLFVSQTFDYILPATSCVLHGRLALPKRCVALDVGMGCSGYVYGMWLASNLIAGGCKRVLLLVGDTISKVVSPMDRATKPLFGDAGSATALEADEGGVMWFEMGTDGAGYDQLMVPAGGFRLPRSDTTVVRREREAGNMRSEEDLFMNGSEVFSFTLREVPAMVQSVLASAGWALEDVNAFVLHQANRFILNHLAKRLKLPRDRVCFSIEEFGNTSSASIPVTIAHCLRERLENGSLRVVLGSFGVGFSWAAVALELGGMPAPELIVLGHD